VVPLLDIGDFRARRAPYAPISALEKFFQRIRDRGVPESVDHSFLRKLNVASNNEYALLSALKFLGIVDDRGLPTHAYRLLQSSDGFRDTLRHLVETAYKPVFDAGANNWPARELVDFFRVSSSPSQSKNAARFFLAACRLAGIFETGPRDSSDNTAPTTESAEPLPSVGFSATSAASKEGFGNREPDLSLRTKARLLEKLPAARAEWSAAEYRAICDGFLEMLRNLDGSA
jgi:hypothetical protein